MLRHSPTAFSRLSCLFVVSWHFSNAQGLGLDISHNTTRRRRRQYPTPPSPPPKEDNLPRCPTQITATLQAAVIKQRIFGPQVGNETVSKLATPIPINRPQNERKKDTKKKVTEKKQHSTDQDIPAECMTFSCMQTFLLLNTYECKHKLKRARMNYRPYFWM